MLAEELLCGCEEGVVDLCESYKPTTLKGRNLGFFEVRRDTECCLIPPDDPLAGKESVTLQNLFGRILALPPEGYVSCADQLRESIKTEGLPIEISEIDQNRILRMMSGLEDTLTTIPESLAHDFAPLVAIPFEEGLFSSHGILYSLKHNVAVERFLEVAQRCAKSFGTKFRPPAMPVTP
jgi:hypothetical protein